MNVLNFRSKLRDDGARPPTPENLAKMREVVRNIKVGQTIEINSHALSSGYAGTPQIKEYTERYRITAETPSMDTSRNLEVSDESGLRSSLSFTDISEHKNRQVEWNGYVFTIRNQNIDTDDSTKTPRSFNMGTFAVSSIKIVDPTEKPTQQIESLYGQPRDCSSKAFLFPRRNNLHPPPKYHIRLLACGYGPR